MKPVEGVEGPEGDGEGLCEVDAIVKVWGFEVRRGDERMKSGERRGRSIVNESVAVVGHVVCIPHAIDGV